MHTILILEQVKTQVSNTIRRLSFGRFYLKSKVAIDLLLLFVSTARRHYTKHDWDLHDSEDY